MSYYDRVYKRLYDLIEFKIKVLDPENAKKYKKIIDVKSTGDVKMSAKELDD